MLKFLGLLTLFSFFAWLGYRTLRRKLRSARGEPEPETTGPRPITVMAALLVAVYGTALLWHLFQRLGAG